jgi:periplasmic divalent cation tolerance protein
MKQESPIQMVLVTVPDKKTARKLAKILLKARLAACASLIPKIESHYWWENEIQSSKETLLLIKTTVEALPKLQELVLKKHPYECPEFIAFTATDAAPLYAQWVHTSCTPSTATREE